MAAGRLVQMQIRHARRIIKFHFAPLTILGKRVISVQRWYRRTSVRSLVILIFFLVVILHLFLRSSESLHTLQAAAALAILYVLWPFLRGTYLIHQKRSMSLQANYGIVDNLRFGELWVLRAVELADLGFKFVACLERSPDHPVWSKNSNELK
jgi:hypothetical protein